MKILQVNCVYNMGSTGKIVKDIHTELLSLGQESIVCYGRMRKTNDEKVIKVCPEFYSKCNNLLSRFTGVMYGGCFFSTNKLISVIKKENPDVVHLHCINGYFVNIYRLVNWLKKNKIKTVLTLHAEIMHTANCGYAFDCEKWKTGCGNCPRRRKETKSYFIDGTARSFKKMKKAFDGFEDNLIVTSVSPWLMERAKLSPILKDKNHIVVLNGLDTTIFYPHGREEIRTKHHLGDKKLVLFVTSSFSFDKNHIKGAWYLVELAKMCPDIIFGVVGARAEAEDLPKNIISIGRVENQDILAKYYSAADLTVLLSKRETFSMVTAESLCCGTPVAGFKAGGPETIFTDSYTAFSEYGNLEEAASNIKRILSASLDREKISAESKSKYDKNVMTAEFVGTYERIIKGEKSER